MAGNGDVIETSDRSWQSSCVSFADRLAFIFNNEWQTDVIFLVGNKEDVKEFKAHRLILALTSPVFEAMFYGQWSEGGDRNSPVVIPDVTPTSFAVLLRYLYVTSGSKFVCQGSLQELLDVFFAADKYGVAGLCDRCEDAIGSLISVDVVCDVYEFAMFHGRKKLEERCSKMIVLKQVQVVASAGFLRASPATLESIVDQITNCPPHSCKCDPYHRARSTLAECQRPWGTRAMPQGHSQSAKQACIFDAICKWAKGRCQTQGLLVSPKNMRHVLGQALFKIRYLDMSSAQFIKGPGASGLFTADEKYALLSNIAVPKSVPLPPGFEAIGGAATPVREVHSAECQWCYEHYGGLNEVWDSV